MITSKTFELLEELASINVGSGSRKAKESILKENIEHLQEYMDIAFNPYKVFNVVQIPESKPGPLFYTTLEKLADYLQSQSGGTDEMKEIVARFLCHAELEYCEGAGKWCELAILKNVRIGVDVKTLNKVGYNIPTFELLLASANKGNDMSGITFPCWAQEKLNGVRCVYFPKLKQFLGRNGKIIPNVNLHSHIEINSDMICDGELYWEGHNFNEIIGLTSSDNQELPEGFKFHIFNVLTEKEWETQECKTNYNIQIEQIIDIVKHGENLEFVKTKIVNSREEVMEFFSEIVGNGGEGVMLRGMESRYNWKRARLNEDTLIKIKQEDYTDGRIIGFYEGKNKYQGALGGFLVQLDNGLETQIGGGFSDVLRKELWGKRDQLINQWILIKYTQRTPDDNLLFPIFQGFRDPK